MDSCIFLGSNSSYSVLEDDNVYLVGADEGPSLNSSVEATDDVTPHSSAVGRSTEFTLELQVHLLFLSLFCFPFPVGY